MTLLGAPNPLYAFAGLFVLLLVAMVLKHLQERLGRIKSNEAEMSGGVRPLRTAGVIHDPNTYDSDNHDHEWVERHQYGGTVNYCSCGMVIQTVGETRIPTVEEALAMPVTDPWETKPHERS